MSRRSVSLLALLVTPGCFGPKAPDAPVIAISPASPVTTDDLVTQIVTPSSGNDNVTYNFAWFRDGERFNDIGDSDTVPADLTARDEIWRVVVTPTRGELVGDPADAFVTIANSPPELTGALEPTSPSTLDDLVATVEATDADEDPVTLTWSWTVDGAPVDVEGQTVAAADTTRGQVWAATIVPSDGDLAGEPLTLTATIADSTPVATSVTLSPEPAYVTDTLQAVAAGEDADGDPITWTYTWIVDGLTVQDGPDDTLTRASFGKHAEVVVEATPNDGELDGDSLASATLVIENSAPTIDGVAIDPAQVREADVATCIPTGWADADGDAEGYTYAWTVNGMAAGSEATLTGSAFGKGDVLACAVTPNDGEEAGETRTSSTVTVSNTAPVVTTVTLSTTAPAEGDTLSVSATATDADDDSIAFTYAWYVNGSMVAATPTLRDTSFARGDTVYVEVTAWDGTDYSTAVVSDVATVANSLPQVTSVSLTPDTAYTDDTLIASVSVSDADGDAVSLTYTWSVDGVPVASTGSTLDGNVWFDKGQTVSLEVTPNDGTADGTGASSATLTIQNSTPTSPIVAVSPGTPEAGVDDLVCAVTTDATDADGDPVTYTFSWTADGVAYTAGGGTVTGGAFAGWSGPETTAEADDTVPVLDVLAGESWTCRVVASDGTVDGAAGLDTVEIDDPAVIGDWPLDGAIATDQSGNGHHGAMSGVTPGAGQVNGAFNFDGVNDYITFGSSSAFDLAGPISVAAWVRSSGASDYAAILTKRQCCSDSTDFAWSLQNSVGEMVFGVYAGSSITWANAGSLAENTWTFIVGVYDGSGVSIYRDGLLVESNAATGAIPVRAAEVVLGGRDATSGYSDFWSGAIDEARMWDRALSAEEIARLYDTER